MRPTTIMHAILLSLGVAVAAPSQADGRDKVPFLQHREKSTLETFPLQSLEQEALSGAVISGTLDAPAVEESDDPPQLKSFLPKLMEPAEDLSDMGRYNISVSIETRAQPAAVEGRTYSWDYNSTLR